MFSWDTELEKDDFDDEFNKMLKKFLHKHNGMIEIFERNSSKLVDFNRKDRKSLYRMTTIMDDYSIKGELNE